MAAASPEYQMNNQRTWPCKSDNGPRFTSFSFQSTKQTTNNPRTNNPTINNPRTNNPTINKPRTNNPTINNHNFQLNPKNQDFSDFSQLPDDVLLKIAATFTLPNLRAASQVCKSWCDGLRPLREAMLFLKYGKRFKHGRGGVKVNLNKALESFLKGAARGSTLAMVDAGLVYWEMGRKEQGISFYRKAAVLGDPAGQCNLSICLLQANPPDSEEAIKWLYKASVAGYVRAQYQLALCLHKGRGPTRNLQEAARWYLKAAEGGYIRAMYNIAMCYSVGEGLVQSHKLARKWMKRAADRGHSKAQFEHGLSLFSEGNMTKAVVYLELATRAGETAADHVKYVILQEMSSSSRDRAMLLADNWRPLPSASR